MKFFKYQGTGNDFIMIDQRETACPETSGADGGRQTADSENDRWLTLDDQVLIEKLCDRRFGIGADGLILLENVPGYDFGMVYFNADGRESSMCGNGGRCIVAFAHALGVFEKKCRFLAIDGPHEAHISEVGKSWEDTYLGNTKWVELKMSDVQQVENQGVNYILNTGSPHFVQFEKTLAGLDVFKHGREIRNSRPFRAEGINVNFVEKRDPNSIELATYERGVEDETLSCGTGATAAAIAYFIETNLEGPQVISVSTKGGPLEVRFEPDGRGGFENIWLCGPATAVFSGEIRLG